MSLIGKVRSRPPADLGLAARALVVVVGIRIALWVLPSRVLLHWVDARLARVRAPRSSAPESRRIGWAVRAASRRVPRASCLTQALSAQLLLAAHGYPSELKIGVQKDATGGIAAHAWVFVGDEVIVGGDGIDRYQVLPDIYTRLGSLR